MANKGVDIPIWPGSGSAINGNTPLALYDTDASYQTDGPNVAIFVAQKLGYPLVDIELQDINIYACFEESIAEYGAQVNQFNIRDNMLDVKGFSSASNFTGKDIKEQPTGMRLGDSAKEQIEPNIFSDEKQVRDSLGMNFEEVELSYRGN